ncbi:MAG: helix-hairpin-helix domain-containing protein [Bacteroidales bacterium]|nr:helix-hairpin-helix domain-containing protein [Bacteroidales bacterium]
MKKMDFNRIASKIFSTTKAERNATFVLAIILLLLAVFSPMYRNYKHSKTSTDPQVLAKVDSFFQALQYLPSVKDVPKKYSVEENEVDDKVVPKSFVFNPNTISFDSLVDLGFTKQQAMVIVKYRQKGGRFYKPSDLKKIYVLDSIILERVIPLVKIVEVVDSSSKRKLAKQSIGTKIELNTADTLMLVKLRGIGKTFARRIVAYRNMLGGFYRLEQLTEVYGLDEGLYQKICDNVTVDTNKIRKINLNTITYNELRKHPYISNYQAKSIIYYRSKVQVINHPVELRDNKLLPNEIYKKFVHYILY